MSAKKVLMVEDDPHVRSSFSQALTEAGFHVLLADTVLSGLEQFRSREPDLVLLDVNLPDGSGFEFCRRVREFKRLALTPIIMLTARSGVEDKEEGFGAGADQYLVKPVSPKEVVLWCQALLRRLEYDSGDGAVLRVKDMSMDPARHVVRCGERTAIRLTVKEFELLYLLVKHSPKALTRKRILAELWKTIAVETVVDSQIHTLRGKLPSDIAAGILTVTGRGYRFFLP